MKQRRRHVNVRSWEKRDSNSDVGFGPFLTDAVEKVLVIIDES